MNIYFRHQGGAVFMGDKQRAAYNELLSFTWGGSCEPGDETLLKVALRDLEQGTELILTHERFRSAEAVAKHEHGWIGCLDKLEKLDEPAEGSRQGW